MKVWKNDNLNSVISRIEDPEIVVFSLSELSDFTEILSPFIKGARLKDIPVIHICFASEPRALKLPENVGVISVDLTHRFEHFTATVHERISSQEEGSFFIFDCLSELQAAWATDRMCVNFFRVTVPLLRRRHDTAFFPLLAGMHSDNAISAISADTDILLDVCSDFRNIYIRARKIDMAKDTSFFQPQVFVPETGEFRLITDGVKLSHFHRAQEQTLARWGNRRLDSWDRFFIDTQRKFQYGEDLAEACEKMCRIMMSRDKRMRCLIKDLFKPEDYFFVKEHMVGSGQIGGKAAGMLTARKIIESKRADLFYMLEAHDSFYIGSDVYASYIVENGYWDLYVRQRREDGYFKEAEELRDKLRNGKFWYEIEEQFIQLLQYYGQAPIIVRSSSVLEDGFDNAFAGKYESVFCPNNGTLRERLESFEDAVRIIYASTMSLSALDYRLRRSLQKRDEQMALLVMRVSGSHYGRYFMPCAAGVGYSFSPYMFLPNIDRRAGMLRLVMGLGTAAVDRTEGSYPRLVSLDNPSATTWHSSSQKHRYSQRKISLIDKTESILRYASLDEIRSSLPRWLRSVLLEHDTEAERVLKERGNYRPVEFVSCHGITIRDDLMSMMRDMMKILQDAYGRPVDIEFTINLSEDGDYVVNLLQCRPLQIAADTDTALLLKSIFKDSATAQPLSSAHVPPSDRFARALPLARGALSSNMQVSDQEYFSEESQSTIYARVDDNSSEGPSGHDRIIPSACADDNIGKVIFLETLHSSMGRSRIMRLDWIVFIDPVAYYEMPYNNKRGIARTLGAVNWHFRDKGKTLVLLTPGRIGTSSPELGVPTAFSDISSFSVICELSESRAGYRPELSYGSHIFQDLVESDILYDAVFEDERKVIFRPNLLKSLHNKVREIDKDAPEEIIGLYDVSYLHCALWHDMIGEHLVINMDQTT